MERTSKTTGARGGEKAPSTQLGQIDRVLFDDWYVVAALDSLASGSMQTSLFGLEIVVEVQAAGDCRVRRLDSGAEVNALIKYGLIWVCLGTPKEPIVEIAEAAEEHDRFILAGGAFRVRVSGLRAIENFLDMAHLPFVHAGYLGVEPHTEIVPYDISVSDRGIVATDCRIFQPLASPGATSGEMVDYVFKVFRPFAAALYKTNPIQRERQDFIGLFVQPVDEETCVAHSLLCYLKDGISAASVRSYMQLIFAQDKPILENQRPRRLPLDPRAEMPVRSDASSITYRNWLADLGVRYGALPRGMSPSRAIARAAAAKPALGEGT